MSRHDFDIQAVKSGEIRLQVNRKYYKEIILIEPVSCYSVFTGFADKKKNYFSNWFHDNGQSEIGDDENGEGIKY